MKIHHTYHQREERIEISTSLAGKQRLAALGLFAVATLIVPTITPKATAVWVPSTLAFLALAIALGRLVYRIKPGSHVLVQLRLLGFPVFSKFIDAATFHSIGITGEDGGSVEPPIRKRGGPARYDHRWIP